MKIIDPSSVHGRVAPCPSSGHGPGLSIYGCTPVRSHTGARLKTVASLSGLYQTSVGTGGKQDTIHLHEDLFFTQAGSVSYGNEKLNFEAK